MCRARVSLNDSGKGTTRSLAPLPCVTRTRQASRSTPSMRMPTSSDTRTPVYTREKELGAPIHPIPALQIMPDPIKFGLQSSTRNQSRPDKDTVMGNTSFVILLVAGLALVARGVLANLLDTRTRQRAGLRSDEQATATWKGVSVTLKG